MVAEEIETPELAEGMAINAMAPFILCARLKGLMCRKPKSLGAFGESNTRASEDFFHCRGSRPH